MATDRMKEPKYVITAINRLTGEREEISRPHSEWKTRELLLKIQRTPGRAQYRQRAYKNPKMEPWPRREEFLPFAPTP